MWQHTVPVVSYNTRARFCSMPAERVKVSRQTINYVENGTYCPSTYLALRIARELGVRVEDIFSLKDTE
jgi:putative transcriptional regulator